MRNFGVYAHLQRIAIVTGARRNIGRAIAIVLAECGHSVAVNEVEVVQSTRTVELIKQAGGQALCIPGDLSNKRGVASIVETTFAHLSEPWVLVNNAAALSVSCLLELDPQEWERTMAVNLRGLSYAVRSSASAWLTQGYRGVS